MIAKEKIQDIVEDIIDSKKQFVVNIAVKPGNKIVVTVDDYNGISLDDCAEISRKVEERLNRDSEDFELEVTSPGLTQPFQVIQQYVKNIEKDVDVLLRDGIKIKAKLISANEKGIEIESKKMIKPEKGKKKQQVVEKQFIEFEKIKNTKIALPF